MTIAAEPSTGAGADHRPGVLWSPAAGPVRDPDPGSSGSPSVPGESPDRLGAILYEPAVATLLALGGDPDEPAGYDWPAALPRLEELLADELARQFPDVAVTVRRHAEHARDRLVVTHPTQRGAIRAYILGVPGEPDQGPLLAAARRRTADWAVRLAPLPPRRGPRLRAALRVLADPPNDRHVERPDQPLATLADQELQRLGLSAGEWALLTAVCRERHWAPRTVPLVWAEVADAVALDRLDRRWGIDGPALVDKLRPLLPLLARDLVAAVERGQATPLAVAAVG